MLDKDESAGRSIAFNGVEALSNIAPQIQNILIICDLLQKRVWISPAKFAALNNSHNKWAD